MSFITGVVALLFCWSVFGAAQVPTKKTSKSERVVSAGCTKPGVEVGCVLVESFKNKKLYNVFFPAADKPEMYTAISFEGTRHNGPTTCMQGTAVDVQKWRPLKTKCPKPAATTKP